MDDEIKVYIGADTGGSGFGEATKGLIKNLLQNDDFLVTVRTHQWGWNEEGHLFDQNIGDERFKHFIIDNGFVNEDYVAETSREVVDQKKQATPLTADLKHSRTVDGEECMIRQFTGKEDVWIGIGGQNFAEYAPDDDDIYTILSTDWNLDKVPRDWEYYLDQVDEVWVPSKWTYESIKNRFENDREDIVENTYWFHYGIRQDYEPTEYDCAACPNERHGVPDQAVEEPCLRDDTFNFLIVSRFYHIKGIYRAIKAYIKEFRGDENVRLFFKTTSNNQFQFNANQAIQSVVQEVGYPDPPEIGITKEQLDKQHMYDLMGQADAFVQVSRAECFGIAQVEAAYCGTPVVYTNWSSQAEVMDEDNLGMFPVDDYELDSPERESQYFTLGGADNYPPDSNWALPSVDEIGNQMRKVYEMSEEERLETGQKASEYVQENFDWTEKVKPRIERIQQGANQ